jgi:hypothetical protein
MVSYETLALGEAFRTDHRGGPAQTPTLKIDGRMVYLRRAVDAEGEVLDVLADQEEQAGSAETHAQAFEEIWLCSRRARHG